jgi:PAS domain S-box-containing protein
MKLDITTILFIASLVYATQTIALFLQYMLNKSYQGLKFWLLGFLWQSCGFFLMPLINVKPVWALSMLANPLILLGLLFLNAGTVAFLEKKRNGWFSIASFSVFLALYAYFIFFNNSIEGRSILVFLSTAAISMKIAFVIFHGKRGEFAASANFTASIFAAYGLSQIAITVVTVSLPPLGSYADIYQQPIRMLSFILPLFVSMLWTFGFILMINQRLNAESREEKEKLRLVFDISPDAQLITRLDDGSIVDVNSGFLSITGHARQDVIERTTVNLDAWANNEDRRRYLAEVNEKGAVKDEEFVFLRKDKSQFIGLVSGSKIMIGGRPHAISVIQDVTERRRAEERIHGLLAEKELILKEVHHRIKNNMNTICSLLSLQAGSLTDPVSISALRDAESRVQSMQMLYDKLYRSNSFSELSASQYFPPLIDEIVANFPNTNAVTIEKEIGDFPLQVGALQPLGIIINELLTNIMKYAFKGGGDHRVKISLSRSEKRVSLVVADNGRGMPESVDFEHPTGLGLVLVKALAEQLRGTIKIEREAGTRIILEIQE